MDWFSREGMSTVFFRIHGWRRQILIDRPSKSPPDFRPLHGALPWNISKREVLDGLFPWEILRILGPNQLQFTISWFFPPTFVDMIQSWLAFIFFEMGVELERGLNQMLFWEKGEPFSNFRSIFFKKRFIFGGSGGQNPMIYYGYKSVSCQCDIVFHLLEGTPPFCFFHPSKAQRTWRLLKVYHVCDRV